MQVQRNTDELCQLMTRVERLENKRSDPDIIRTEVEKFWDKERVRQVDPQNFLTGARTIEQELGRQKKFEESRRALRIWPIGGKTPQEISDNLSLFLQGALLLSKTEVDSLGIDWVERTRVAPRSKIHNEVRILLPDPRTRDFLASKGRMLSTYVDNARRPTAGFRMDIPDYLAKDYKILEDYAFRMREAHGRDTRKSIRYDDNGYTIYLDLKLPGSMSWLRITPDLARELRERRNKDDIEAARPMLMARPRMDPYGSIGSSAQGSHMAPPNANLTPLGQLRHRAQLARQEDQQDSSDGGSVGSAREDRNPSRTVVQGTGPPSGLFGRPVTAAAGLLERRADPPRVGGTEDSADIAAQQTWRPGTPPTKE